MKSTIHNFLKGNNSNSCKKQTTLFRLCILAMATLLLNSAMANNVQCSVTNYNSTTGVLSLSFSWDNSWRTTAGGAEFKDGILLFVKYKDNLNPNWRSAPIAAGSGYSSPGNGDLGDVNYKLSTQYVPLGMAAGAFDHLIVSRATTNLGTGTISGGTSLSMYIPGAVNPSFKVFALEMVNVPEGAFAVGDGGSLSNTLSGEGQSPYTVSSNDAICVANNVGCIHSGFTTATIAASFPKGFNNFWMMKYELSQELYVAYLNCLTRTQQDAAIHPTINLLTGTTTVANTYVMTNTATTLYNQGIRCAGTIPVSGPITFYCDLSGDNVGNGVDDAQNNAVRVYSPTAALQFLDWAGMRPMSGFEFEKACRGTATPVLNEYAWGSTDAYTPTTTTTGNAAENYIPVADGPLVTTTAVRNGVFATATSTRRQSGGSFYGIMELSNSLPELNAGYGFETGTTGFTTALGDGNITNGLPASFPTGVKVQNMNGINNRVSCFIPTTYSPAVAYSCAIRGVIQ